MEPSASPSKVSPSPAIPNAISTKAKLRPKANVDGPSKSSKAPSATKAESVAQSPAKKATSSKSSAKDASSAKKPGSRAYKSAYEVESSSGDEA